MMLEQGILTELGFNLKLSEHVIKADDVPFNKSTSPVVDSGTYIHKYLNTGEIIPGESFTNYFVKEVYESEHVRTATK